MTSACDSQSGPVSEPDIVGVFHKTLNNLLRDDGGRGTSTKTIPVLSIPQFSFIKSPTFTDSPDNAHMIRAPNRAVVVTELNKITPILFRLGNDYPNTINVRVFDPH